jgi:hypothetical protein
LLGSTGERIVASATNEIDDIRRRMALIRRELHEDIRGVVESAEAVTDWKHWIRDYPWASMALAAGVGFWLVPKRRKLVKPQEVARAVVAEIQPAVQTVQAAVPAPEPKQKGRGLIGAGLGLIGPIVMRAAQNYATHLVSHWIAQQKEQMAHAMAASGQAPRMGQGPGHGPGHAYGPGPGPGFGMGRPGSGPSQTQGGMR